MDAVGNYVVVWNSENQDGDEMGIYAQRYHVDGTPAGDEFRVNSRTNDSQRLPDVAMNAAGQFVIVWESEDQDGSGWGIFGQRYHADGTRSGWEFRANTLTADDQWKPGVAMDDAGRFVVAWQSHDTPGDPRIIQGVYARLFDADSTPVGDEFLVSTATVDLEPSAAMSPSGRFAIAWGTRGAYVRAYNADGTPGTGEIQVIAPLDYLARTATVEIADSGEFVVVGFANTSSSGSSVTSHRFDAEGRSLSPATTLASGITGNPKPSIAMDARGRYIVTWYDGSGLRAVMFDSNGWAVGPEFSLGVLDSWSNVAMGASGRAATVWTMWNTGDGDDGSVHVRRFDAFSDDEVHRLTLAPGQTVSGRNFGAMRAVTISGQTFEDRNADAARNAGEVGLDGWFVELVNVADGRVQARQATSSIDLNGDGVIDGETESGLYEFARLLPGTYTVREIVRDGWKRITPSSGQYTVTGNAGDTFANRRFGNYKTSTITGRVFEDLDGGGTHDVGERGLDGWSVQLLDPATGQVVTSTLTAGLDVNGDGQIDPITESGFYTFEGIMDGQYEVSQILQGGWRQTAPVGSVHAITLGYDAHPAGVDFGNQSILSEIHGQKFDDLNGNGVRDGAEVGLDGWTIELLDPLTRELLASTVTASIDVNGDGQIDPATESGLYSFVGLDYDTDFEVRHVPRDGWVQTAPTYQGVGLVGEEFQVNTSAVDRERIAELAMNDAGQAVVVWYNASSSNDGIFIQRYAADGTPDGEEFQIDDPIGGIGAPLVAMDQAGGFVVMWGRLHGQIYHADGTPRGNQFTIGPDDGEPKRHPAVAMQDTGEFIVAWAADVDIGKIILAQRFAADGTPLGDYFKVNGPTDNYRTYPAVAVANSGQFVVTWLNDTTGYGLQVDKGIYARVYNADGTPAGDEFLVNAEYLGGHHHPSVAMDDSGRFVVVWDNTRGWEGPYRGSYGRAFHADGRPNGGDFKITAGSSPVDQVRIAMMGDGGFVAVWQEILADSGLPIMARAYRFDGRPIGRAVAITDVSGNGGDLPVIGIDGAGNAMVAWFNGANTAADAVQALRWAALRSPASRVMRLDPGQISVGNDFGGYLSGAVSGEAFDDVNADGARGAGEAGLNGWDIELVDSVSGQVIESIHTMSVDRNGDGVIDTQDEAGRYEFTGLLPGDYVVRQIWQRGWAPISPITGSQSVTVVADAVETVNFANHALGGDVRGQKFQDDNANGLPDAGEAGLDGWTVELVDFATGAVLATTVTAGHDLNGDGAVHPVHESGLYAFSGLADGIEYVVREVARSGWVQTAPDSINLNPIGEIVANTYVTDAQGHPAIAMNTAGQHVIVWGSVDQDGHGWGIYAQRYYADGTPNGGEFQVNTYTPFGQSYPDVAMNGDGRFVVVWQGRGLGWDERGIFAQLYDADGLPVGSEFQVNPHVSANYLYPVASMDPDGSFIFSWTIPHQSDSGVDIYAQRYLADGTADGGTLALDSYDGYEQVDPLAAMDDEGNFVRVRVTDDRDDEGVFAQLYFADGTPNGNEFQVNTYYRNEQFDPAVTMASDGRFAVTWQSGGFPGPYNIYAQMYRADGTPLGGEVRVNTALNEYPAPDIAMDDSGDFLIAWQDAYSRFTDHDISIRRFTPRQVHRISHEAGNVTAGLDFGNYRVGSIAGQVFEDLDGDGQRDPGEGGIDGWRVELVDDAGGVLATAVSFSHDVNDDGTIDPVGEAGMYRFSSVMPGTYTVRIVAQASWVQTAPASESHVVDLGMSDVTDGDFGVARPVSISGTVFEDVDGSAVRDPGEPGLDGWIIELVDPGDGQVLVAQATSGGGAYAFDDLMPGQYEIRLTGRSNWAHTLPASGAYVRTIVSSQVATGWDFGVQAAGGEIHGVKWHDVNGDGVKDADEAGLDGWTIELLDRATGQVVATQITASADLNGDGTIDPISESGLYAFTDVRRGEYEVREVAQAGWELTWPDASGELTFVEAFTDGQDGVDGLDFPYSATVSDDGACVYVTGYSDDAVAVFTRDSATGQLTFVGAWKDGVGGVDGLDAAFAVAASPDRRHVYVAGSRDNALAVFAQDPATNALTFVQVVKTGIDGVSGLRGVRDVTVSPDGAHVYAAGNSDDAVAVFSRDAATGELTFIEAVKNGVGGVDGLDGAYSVVVSPDGRNVYAAGYISDALVAFTRDATTGRLTMLGVLKDGVDGVDGLNGARMASVSPDGRHVYTAGYSDNALAVFSRDDATGDLAFVQMLRDGDPGVDGLARAVSVAVSPDGLHVYAVGYSDQSVTALSRNATTGELTVTQLATDAGSGPYSAVVSPDGRHVYATAVGGDVLTVFSRANSPVYSVTLDVGQVATGRNFAGYRLVSVAPGALDLRPADDTGVDDGDNLTALDNSSPSSVLQFAVINTPLGSTVTLYADGIAIGSVVTAIDGLAIVTTNGAHDLADGEHTITARQSEPGKAESPDSAGLAVTIDTAAPSVEALGLSSTSAGWTPGTLDSALWTTGRASRTAPWSGIDQLVVSFDEPVVLAAGDVTLAGMDSDATNPTAVTDSPTGQVTCTLAEPLVADRYTMILAAGVTDAAGNALGVEWSTGLNVLAGDLNGDGRVSSRDRRELRNAYASVTGDAAYTIFADLNGDGRISSRDRRTLRDNYATALPALPAPAPVATPTPGIGDADSGDRVDRKMGDAPLFLSIRRYPTVTALAMGEIGERPLFSSPEAPLPTASDGAEVRSASQLEPDLSAGLTNPLE